MKKIINAINQLRTAIEAANEKGKNVASVNIYDWGSATIYMHPEQNIIDVSTMKEAGVVAYSFSLDKLSIEGRVLEEETE